MTDWKDYQEEAATFFRTLGLSAETDVRIQGTRTAHDVDVVVKSVHVGFDITWLVECKHWKTPVSKLHVLGLRQIVIDLGADRGILLSEAGFQSGATEAASLTNVQLTSLAALRESTKYEIFAMRLRELFDRVEACSERYWDISKADRIDMGLRPDVGEDGYSGDQVIVYCRDVLFHSMRASYPITLESLQVLAYPNLKREFSGPHEVVPVLDELVAELESKLAGSPS
jgi:restriction system protein